MSDPETTARNLYIQTTGSNVGTWGTVLNADFSAVDSMFGNVATIALTNSNVTLTTPPNSGAAWSGPYQSQSAILRFTGTLTATCAVTIPVPGFFIVYNNCIVGSFGVYLSTGVIGGYTIGLPPGQAMHVFSDGTNMNFANLPLVGSYVDLAVTAVPAWIDLCSIPPYLNCDGTTFNATQFPVLNALLGGNTLPDIRGRFRASLNQGTGRITSGAGGVDGNTLFAAGGGSTQILGTANLPPYTPTGGIGVGGGTNGAGGVYTGVATGNRGQIGDYVIADIIGNITASFGGNPQGGTSTPFSIIPPTTISGLTLIRAA